MKRPLLILASIIGLGSPVLAACPSPLTGKDAGNTIQNFGVTVGSDNSCYGNVALVDGTNAANKATVTAAGALSVSLLSGAAVDLGAQADTVAPTDTSTASLIALVKRGDQTLTTINTSINSDVPDVTGPLNAATAVATKMLVDGGQYLASLPTMTNTQQGALLLDVNGRLLTNAYVSQWGGGVLGAMANYGTSTGAVLVPGVNAFITNTPTVTANPTTAASWGLGATGAAIPANAVLMGCTGSNVEQTAVTNGQLTSVPCGLGGKLINKPYSVKELDVRGTASGTDTSAHTIIAAAGGSNKNYITGTECSNTSATTTTVTFNDSVSTIMIVPAGGGNNATYLTPLVTAAATAFQFTATAGVTTIYCNAQGYTGL